MGVDVQALVALAALRRAIDTIGSDRAREAFFAPKGRKPTAATLRVEARHEELRRLVVEEGVTLRDELAERLGVSVTCVERDAEALELETESRIGRLRRETAERRAWLGPVVLALWGREVPSTVEVADRFGLPRDQTRTDLRVLGIRSRYWRRTETTRSLLPTTTSQEEELCQSST